MGITFLAAGTSVSDCMASLIVARQGGAHVGRAGKGSQASCNSGRGSLPGSYQGTASQLCRSAGRSQCQAGQEGLLASE